MPEHNFSNSGALDRFESILAEGLLKICRGENLLDIFYECPDVESRWDVYIRDYVSDAVENFNDYPDAALGFAAYLGMAVAHNWDRCWEAHSEDSYQSYYGPRGFDDMDDHIVKDVLHLGADRSAALSSLLLSCTQSTLGLIRHEEIETQTAFGFHVLVRSYCVFFRLGVSLELRRLGYGMVRAGGPSEQRGN